MLVVTRHRPADGADFVLAARSALTALRAQPGCESAELVRDIDDGGHLSAGHPMAGVGSYRRALSSYDVKVLRFRCWHRRSTMPAPSRC